MTSCAIEWREERALTQSAIQFVGHILYVKSRHSVGKALPCSQEWRVNCLTLDAMRGLTVRSQQDAAHRNVAVEAFRSIGRGHLVLRRWFYLSLAASAIWGQSPVISPGGIVNAASYGQLISPGGIASIFGTNLADSPVVAPAGTPMLKLGTTQVTVNGISARLFFASPSQINLQVPSSVVLPSIAGGFPMLSFVVTTEAGSSPPSVQSPAFNQAPALFTLDSSGCGPAAALNAAADGSVTVNSPSNSAAPGDYISIYGTGLGTEVAQPVADGSAPTGSDRLLEQIGVSLNGSSLETLSDYEYEGLAPFLPGVDQINLRIPPDAQEGCSIPIAEYAPPFLSQTATISIHSGRGRCVDPPVASYGQISLTKTVASGTDMDGETETLTASFPSAPGLRAPDPQPMLPVGVLMPGIKPVPSSRTCPVSSLLSVGSIIVQNEGTQSTAEPLDVPGGVEYQQILPNGFIRPGQYALMSSGSTVGIQGAVSVGSPIEIQSTSELSPGSAIDPYAGPLTIRWTGGDPGTRVRITLQSLVSVYPAYVYAETDASAGAITLRPVCSEMSGTLLCDWDVAPSDSEEVIVDVFPNPASTPSFPALGITGGVFPTWDYRYIFGGLTLK